MSAATIYSQAPGTVISGSGNSSILAVGNFVELVIDITVTAKTGTSPTVQFFIDRLGADGIEYNIWSSSVISTVTTTISQSIGAGLALPSAFGGSIQFRWALGGTSPTWTYSVSLIGK